MTNEDLLKEINSLSADAKRRVEKFISKIRQGYSERPRISSQSDGSFRDEPFFGIWADREDMKDGGAAWVKKTRREQWDRRRIDDPR
jgi:hypothetical protein